jgi:hypothetical protein
MTDSTIGQRPYDPYLGNITEERPATQELTEGDEQFVIFVAPVDADGGTSGIQLAAVVTVSRDGFVTEVAGADRPTPANYVMMRYIQKQFTSDHGEVSIR